jgi:hypothetical protein
MSSGHGYSQEKNWLFGRRRAATENNVRAVISLAGRFIEMIRPLLLGWIVNLLGVIPVAGTLLAAIGWTAVLMMVFEEVDEIERLQAFGISAGINVVFTVLMFMLAPQDTRCRKGGRKSSHPGLVGLLDKCKRTRSTARMAVPR